MSKDWGLITAQEILSPIGAARISGNPRTILTGISTDSRSIRRGECFWALKGDRYDGHDFAGQAIREGASAIVIQPDRFEDETEREAVVVIAVEDTRRSLGDLAAWWRRQHRVQVVAVTGSAGKTTTKEMTAAILEQDHRTLRNPGNLNNLIGLPLTLLRLEETHERTVLEMGMNRPGEILRLTEIADPDVGVITNVGMAHLEGVGDVEGVAKAKVELLEKISPRAKVVLNGDDERLMRTAAPFRKEGLTFGIGTGNDVRAEKIRDLGGEGIAFLLVCPAGSVDVRVRPAGLQNVLNALAAASAGLCLDEPLERVAEGLRRFSGMRGRFNIIALREGATLVDDTYNSNPLSLRAALDSIQSLVEKGGRIIVALGEMMELGAATVSAHREAGRWVGELRPHYFLAMGEHARDMLEGAAQSGMPSYRFEAVRTLEEMQERIKGEMRQGDLIFLKGSRKMGLDKVVEALKGFGRI
jgi:UDP-N-acetylmuramoyl-tripeptide--D-alanyl-D-alanine ligase